MGFQRSTAWADIFKISVHTVTLEWKDSLERRKVRSVALNYLSTTVWYLFWIKLIICQAIYLHLPQEKSGVTIAVMKNNPKLQVIAFK